MTFGTHLTQFPGKNKIETHTIIIGLDFGTSSSKVVIRNHSAGIAFAIPFDSNGHPCNKFLLPTRPYFSKDGKLCISSNSSDIPLRELKKALITDNELNSTFVQDKELEASPLLLTIAYLAQTIRLSRAWFLENKRDAFQHAKLEWQLNLGVPSVGNDFHTKKEIFKNIAICAWWLSTEKGEITIEGSEKALTLLKKSSLEIHEIHSDNINIIPEIVAEVIGYARSHHRQEGLHLLIDIGAGTLDIASFILHTKQGDDCYSILTGDVSWLGAFELHKNRIENIKKNTEKWLNNLGKNEDPVQPIPEKLENYLPSSQQIDLQNVDVDFLRQCKIAINKTIVYLRKYRDPNSPQWASGIPTFLCGGGSNTGFYLEVLEKVNEFWKSDKTQGLKTTSLPKPADIENHKLLDSDYHRLAVAYGLSFPEYDIGNIKTPSEIDDIHSSETLIDYTKNFVSKDEV